MNEKIKEIYIKAKESMPFRISNPTDQFIIKFTELIVKECAEVAHCNSHVSGVSLGNAMKERFGIEE